MPGPPGGNDAALDAFVRQPQIRIVGAQQQAILGARGEHAVGLACPERDQIVDHHADIGVGPVEHEFGRAGNRKRRVEPGNQALSRRLFIASRAVDLAGQEQPGQHAAFEGRQERARVDEIVFDGVAGLEDLRPLQPPDGADHPFLHILRQRGRNAVRVDRVVVQSFGLEENLVAFPFGEADDLVLDRRTIARPDTLDLAGIKRRPADIGPDLRVGLGIRVGDVANGLRNLDPAGEE